MTEQGSVLWPGHFCPMQNLLMGNLLLWSIPWASRGLTGGLQCGLTAPPGPSTFSHFLYTGVTPRKSFLFSPFQHREGSQPASRAADERSALHCGPPAPAWPVACFVNKVFIGTQTSLHVHLLPLAALTLQWLS